MYICIYVIETFCMKCSCIMVIKTYNTMDPQVLDSMYEIHLISFINKILQFFRIPQVRTKSPNFNLLHYCVEKEIEFPGEIPVEYYH